MTSEEFIKTLDNGMAMKTGDWLENKIKSEIDIVLLDLRSQEAWEKGHIIGSVQVNINDLPEKVKSLIPNSESTVVSICNGSIQSAMATMFLRTADYKNSFNLSGGFSSWIRNNRPITS